MLRTIHYKLGITVVMAFALAACNGTDGTIGGSVSPGNPGGGGSILPNVSFSEKNLTFISGVSVGTVAPVVSGAAARLSISPALPSGLSFDTSTGAISGTPSGESSLQTYVVKGGAAEVSVTISVVQDAPTGAIVGTVNPSGAADPTSITAFEGFNYFAADSDSDGIYELWKSDGTSSGTSQVLDGAGAPILYVANLTALSHSLYFAAQDPNTGNVGIWKLENDAASLVSVQVLNPSQFIEFNSMVFFTGASSDGTTGAEFFVTDGTDAGTALVADLYPGNSRMLMIRCFRMPCPGGGGGPNSSSPKNFKVLNGKLIFMANNAGGGVQPFVSDGTTAGTIPLVPDSLGYGVISSNSAFAVMGNYYYFDADDGVNGNSLWRTDGTTAGTELVAGSEGSQPYTIAATSNKVFFDGMDTGVGSWELFVFDGTSLNLLDFDAGNSFDPWSMYVHNGVLYMSGYDAATGYELWKSDGTLAGTTLVSDINSSGDGLGSYDPNFTSVGNWLYFIADSGSGSREVWRSDGVTTENTGLVVSSTPVFSKVGSKGLFVNADDGVFGSQLTLVTNPH